MNWTEDGHLQRAQQKISVVILRYCVTSWSEQFKAHAEEYFQNGLTMHAQTLASNLLESLAMCTLWPDGTPSVQPWPRPFGLPLLWIIHRWLKMLPIYQCPKKWRYWCSHIFIWLHGCQSKKKYLRALRNLFIIGRNVLKSSETICKNDVLTHFVLAASLLSNCWFFLTHKHILLILVSLTERWSWVHSILPSNSGYNSRLLWCLSGIPGNCHDGFCPHPILFDIQYSPHCETKWSLSYWISLNKL